ncbi:MAG: hypothetical protein JRF46_17085 [Deltaproteobacteria bacterium]|nr:hypothetical protein [Deltaproteobacteria bacterium]
MRRRKAGVVAMAECCHEWHVITYVVKDFDRVEIGPAYDQLVQCSKCKEIAIGPIETGHEKGPKTAPTPAPRNRFEQRGGHLYINGRKVLKGWESFSGWFWFGVERVKDSDELWFGLVQGFEDEWGYFSEHVQCARSLWVKGSAASVLCSARRNQGSRERR